MSRRMEFSGGPQGTYRTDLAASVTGLGGKVFYVNASAGGANDVDSPFPDVDNCDLCFDTLQGAIDKCVSSRGDKIFVKGSEAVTSAVNFNKTGIHVKALDFGIDPMARGEYNAIYSETIVDGPVAIISAGCRIEGLGFAGDDATTGFFAGAALLIGGAAAGAFGVHLKNCRFPKWGLDNSHGLSIAGGAAVSNVLIEDCDFEGAFDSGIYVQGAVGHLQIKGCRFNLATYAVEFGAFADAGVNSQIIYGPGNITVTPTKGLNTGSNACKGMVCGNYFGTAVGTGTNDLNTANMETAGYIMVGNEYATEGTGPT